MDKRPNLFERAIAFFSPEKAVRREAARHRLGVINSGYSTGGASTTKKSMVGWDYTSRSASEDIDINIPVLRQRCRSLCMTTPVAAGAVRTARTNVVGSGLKLRSSVDADALGMTEDQADEWERNVEKEFALWARNCDAARTADFYQLQRLAFLSAMMSGDVFATLPMLARPGDTYALKVNLIEADRVCNPPGNPDFGSFQQGIETDDFGAPVFYHIAKYHPYGLVSGKPNEWAKVPAFGVRTGRRNVLHIKELERPGQRRGVPMLAPVIEALKQLGRYTDAELMAAVVSGMFTVAITRENEEGDVGEMSNIPEDQQREADPNAVALGNGTIFELAPGEDVKSINPGRPNALFDPFVLSILRQVGAALEIPLEVLIKHFTASYSASRAALLEAWKHFRSQRAWFAKEFCQPIYEEWLQEAVATGRISAPGFFFDARIRAAYSGAEWNGPSPGQIDPQKEVEAAVLRVQNCFSTRTKETAELTGGDFGQNVRQRITEEQLMREGGLIVEQDDNRKVLADKKPDEDES